MSRFKPLAAFLEPKTLEKKRLAAISLAARSSDFGTIQT